MKDKLESDAVSINKNIINNNTLKEGKQEEEISRLEELLSIEPTIQDKDPTEERAKILDQINLSYKQGLNYFLGE
ncbi:MAG: hypothetical protein K0Q51_1543, partial [Rickettsiaceae bacterium]|nr:hypothetical protein [Rickettsiaceae bacterium]